MVENDARKITNDAEANFRWVDLRKIMNTSVRIASASLEMQTQYHPNTSPGLCQCTYMPARTLVLPIVLYG
jgi:hypothetical protein